VILDRLDHRATLQVLADPERCDNGVLWAPRSRDRGRPKLSVPLSRLGGALGPLTVAPGCEGQMKSRPRASGYSFPALHRHLPRAQTAQTVNSQGGSDGAGVLERLLSVGELSELLQLHTKTVKRMARDGRVPSIRVAGRLRFRPSDIASWLAAREDRACHGS